MTTLKFHYAPPVGPTPPRGSRFAATLAAALLDGIDRIAAALRRRQAPSPAKTPAEQAQEVRELAWQMRQLDPRFADDLLAAADRHERLHGVG